MSYLSLISFVGVMVRFVCGMWCRGAGSAGSAVIFNRRAGSGGNDRWLGIRIRKRHRFGRVSVTRARYYPARHASPAFAVCDEALHGLHQFKGLHVDRPGLGNAPLGLLLSFHPLSPSVHDPRGQDRTAALSGARSELSLPAISLFEISAPHRPDV